MTPTIESLDERRVRHLLEALGEATPPLGDEGLAALARAASATDQALVRRSTLRPSRRALLVAATVALAAGVGIGRWLAPAEATQALVLPAFEPAFLPAAGWTVVNGGVAVPAGMRAALAANVPLPADGGPLDILPDGVLEQLPSGGIVVVASARAGDAGGRRTPPARGRLLLSEAAVQTVWVGAEGAERGVAEYALDARRSGLDLDVRVYVGDSAPSARVLAEAQAQLDRLVVRGAANQVTMAVRPTVLNWGQTMTVWGAVSGGRAGESVTLEIRECGTTYWRAFAGATTSAGGSWSTSAGTPISGAIRARWDDHTSPAVAIRLRPGALMEWRNGRYKISFGGTRSFWRKLVRIERLNPQTRRWVKVRDVRLAESGAAGYMHWSWATFQLPGIRRGTTLRAVLPAMQARPCYLAGVTNTVRR